MKSESWLAPIFEWQRHEPNVLLLHLVLEAIANARH
jgi:hypothetical protein